MAPPFLVPALDRSEWSASYPGRHSPGELATRTHLRKGHAVACFLKHCATNRKIVGSRPDEVNGFFFFSSPIYPILPGSLRRGVY
jgi:hypothetical protein